MQKEKRKTKGTADTIDKHVGQQLRSRRSLLGLSQEKLADSIGVTFQQVQKYERGANRISASRLFSFSKILDVSIDYFYEGLPEANDGEDDQSNMPQKVKSSNKNGLPEDLLAQKETIHLLRAYYSVDSEEKRKVILKLVKSMAKNIT